MGIIIDENTNVLVQGMTGKEGRIATKQMIDYKTKVSCGVTPGKGGMKIENLPIFDSVKEAIAYDPKINTSVLYVPPLTVYDATMEAIENNIKTIIIVTENVPVKDSARLINYAKQKKIMIIGPSSVGVINLGVGKVGSIGGELNDAYSKGNIGIISKSGGMCAETASILTKQGIGQSTVVGIGGDVIIGSNFVEILSLFEKDDDTKAIVLFGEIGGNYEEQVAEQIKNFKKPIIAYISGSFAEAIKRNFALGHAGAIIEHGQGNATEKKKKLKDAGFIVADFHHDIPDLVKKVLKNGI